MTTLGLGIYEIQALQGALMVGAFHVFRCNKITPRTFLQALAPLFLTLGIKNYTDALFPFIDAIWERITQSKPGKFVEDGFDGADAALKWVQERVSALEDALAGLKNVPKEFGRALDDALVKIPGID